MSKRTLYDKIWDDHFVASRDDGSDLMYVDRHLVHEVTSPQAFEGLRENNLKPRRVSSILATPDHNVPTTLRKNDLDGIKDPISKLQVLTLDENCNEFGINQFKLNDQRQGIVHVIGPEQGLTLPGMTIVCGDSHTATHGAFGALAFGIGTSEVEMVLGTQCIMQPKPKKMRIKIDGILSKGVTAKDIALYIISQISTSGGTGYFIEYAGSAIEGLTMEGRMTLCNMSIESGARGGLIAPDQTTFDYLSERQFSPKNKKWEDDFSPVDEDLTPQYSKAYLKHLFKAKEYLGAQIASEHNLKFYLWLVGEARKRILNDTFVSWKNSIVKKLDQRL